MWHLLRIALLNLLIVSPIAVSPIAAARAPLVFMSDFGLRDGAVAAMKGVAYGISQELVISDITHEEPASIFEAAYRLYQAEAFWPQGTVFVVVVDPGVGTDRLSIVLKTRNGHYFVGPDNGLFSLVAEQDGIEELRQIDEKVNRRPGSENSHTFHGRDVFAYTGARLASGTIEFSQVGPQLPPQRLIRIPYRQPAISGNTASGLIPVLDIQYGNVWSNIPQNFLDRLGVKVGDSMHVKIYQGATLVDELRAPYAKTFGNVPVGKPLIYINSLMNVAIALNQGSYAGTHKIGSGVDWFIEVSKD